MTTNRTTLDYLVHTFAVAKFVFYDSAVGPADHPAAVPLAVYIRAFFCDGAADETFYPVTVLLAIYVEAFGDAVVIDAFYPVTMPLAVNIGPFRVAAVVADYPGAVLLAVHDRPGRRK